MNDNQGGTHERFCCCCGFIKNEPCGYPKGTVRSTIAIIVATIGMLMSIGVVAVLLAYQEWALAIAFAEAPLAVLSLVVGNYFGARSASKDNKKTEETRLLSDNEVVIIDSPDLDNVV